MSTQYIAGSVGQSVTQEHGEFITVEKFRIRVSLIYAYAPGVITEADEKKPGVIVYLTGGSLGIICADEAARDKEVTKLDRYFAKQYGLPSASLTSVQDESAP
jgi:hypothetical protein